MRAVVDEQWTVLYREELPADHGGDGIRSVVGEFSVCRDVWRFYNCVREGVVEEGGMNNPPTNVGGI